MNAKGRIRPVYVDILRVHYRGIWDSPVIIAYRDGFPCDYYIGQPEYQLHGGVYLTDKNLAIIYDRLVCTNGDFNPIDAYLDWTYQSGGLGGIWH